MENMPITGFVGGLVKDFITSPWTMIFLGADFSRRTLTEAEGLKESLHAGYLIKSTRGTALGRLGVEFPKKSIITSLGERIIGVKSDLAREYVEEKLSKKAARMVTRRAGSLIYQELKSGGIQAAWNKAKSIGLELGVASTPGAAGTKLFVGMLGTATMSALNFGFTADTIIGLASLTTNVLYEIGRPQDTTPRFYDTPVNATMRQTALQAIYDSQLSTRSAFGREASFLHR